MKLGRRLPWGGGEMFLRGGRLPLPWLGPVWNGATPGKRQAAPAKIHLSSARRQAQANLHVEPPCSTDTPEHWLDLHEVPQLACQPLGLVLGDQRVGVPDLDQFRVA